MLDAYSQQMITRGIVLETEWVNVGHCYEIVLSKTIIKNPYQADNLVESHREEDSNRLGVIECRSDSAQIVAHDLVVQTLLVRLSVCRCHKCCKTSSRFI